MINSKSRYSLANIGIVCAVMMLVIMLPSMIQNHGIYIIRGDYVDQYIPRLIKARENLLSGSGTWDWYNFLGAQYNITNTFFTLNSVCLLFSAKLIPYVVTYMHLVRFALVGMTSFAYLRYMVKEQRYAFLGAILYTFSSYTFLNFEFMQFIDALWVFPLLLLSVEKMFRSNNYKHQLIIVSFLACTSSFYFFVFSSLSFGIYFVCRFFFADEWQEKRNAKYFAIAVIEYVIGFLCAGFLVTPYLYKTFTSAGSAEKIGNETAMSWFNDGSMFSRLTSLFLPAASNRFDVFGWSRWMSRAAYVPVFGISFVSALFFNKKMKNKKWINILSIVSFACILWSGISIVYNMFSSTYTRYAYAMVLFFVLATVIFLENYDHESAKRGVIIAVGGCSVLLLAFYLTYYVIAPLYEPLAASMYTYVDEQPIASGFRIFVIAFAIVMYLVLIAILKFPSVRKRIVPITAALLVAYGGTYTVMNLESRKLLDYYPESTLTLGEQVEKYYIEMPSFEDSKDYRIDHSKHLRNYSFVTSKPSISVFESVQNSYSVEMGSYLNMYNGTVTIYPVGSDNDVRTLLGVKYYYDLHSEDKLPIPEGFTYEKTDNGIDVYKNDNFVGMGFTYEYYMTRSEFEALQTPDTAASIMLNTLIVEDKDVAFVSKYLKHNNSLVEYTNRQTFDNFETNSSGFTASVYTEKESVMFISVPYEDEGWTLTVNGKQVPLIRANVGCMAFKTVSGANNITLTYASPANNVGYIITAVGVALLVVYLSVCLIKSKNNK